MRVLHLLVASSIAALGVLVAPAALAAAPPNDNRATPQAIGRLPAHLTATTVEATKELGEPFSSCGDTGPSVWFRLTAADSGRIVLALAAAGDLDTIVDVYREQRSRLTAVGCDASDTAGRGGLNFTAEKSGVYVIRVAQLPGSVPEAFTLDVTAPQPAARPPGRALPGGGITSTVDRVQNPSDAWSAVLRTGRTYRIRMIRRSESCPRMTVFGPGTTSFEDDSPVDRFGCDDYAIFTPGPDEEGRYSFLVQADGRDRRVQRYHLQVAAALADDTAPGIRIGNDARVRGALRGSRADVVDLYRFDVTSRSELTLTLSSSLAEVDLELRNDRGRRITCDCRASRDAQVRTRLRPGRFFAAVRARGSSGGKYTLARLSRTITATKTTFSNVRHAHVGPGAAATLRVNVSPGATGPAAVIIERFDPLAGWQFFSLRRVQVVGGSGGFSFLPPVVGRWRARSQFLGTRRFGPSQGDTATLLVAGPLAQ
jgi:hypothetical protein